MALSRLRRRYGRSQSTHLSIGRLRASVAKQLAAAEELAAMLDTATEVPDGTTAEIRAMIPLMRASASKLNKLQKDLEQRGEAFTETAAGIDSLKEHLDEAIGHLEEFEDE